MKKPRLHKASLLKKQRSFFIFLSLSFASPLFSANSDPLLELIAQAEKNVKGLDSICHNEIYDRTRLLIYSGFLESLKQRPEAEWEAIVNRYSSVSYLACMESNGRPVTIVTHGRERFNESSKYGYAISDLMTYLNHFNKMSWNYRNQKFNQWYDASTNFGVFQISADRLIRKDTETQRKTAETFQNIIRRFQSIATKTPGMLMDKCFTRIMYLDDSYDPQKPLLKNILEANSYKGLAPQNASSKMEWVDRAQKIQSFAVANILCPRLNLELAKALMSLEPQYFGPHWKDSSRCGDRTMTCRNTLNEMINIIHRNRGF